MLSGPSSIAGGPRHNNKQTNKSKATKVLNLTIINLGFLSTILEDITQMHNEYQKCSLSS